jgi:hypothetical protein
MIVTEAKKVEKAEMSTMAYYQREESKICSVILIVLKTKLADFDTNLDRIPTIV